MYRILLGFGIVLAGCTEPKQPKPKKVYKQVPRYLALPNYEGLECLYERAVEVTLNPNGTGSFVTCIDHTITRNGPVTSGRPKNYRTPRGDYQINWQAKKYDSKKYPSTDGTRNMDYASFFHKGYALHQGSVRALSHGCIHLRKADAKYIYENFNNGDTVIVQ